ncbi:Fibronectin type 3 and ankyrin repeat domains protein 1 [Camellia lanceoleosa]|nr:Fibronectin type 3 and ankyrin repeat domains protein 1 [Camellia lanceoleosa]
MEIDPPKKPEVGAEAIKDDDFFNAAEHGDSSFFEALSHDQLLKALSLKNEDCRSLLHVAASSAHSKVHLSLFLSLPNQRKEKKRKEKKRKEKSSFLLTKTTVKVVKILSAADPSQNRINKADEEGADVNLKNNGGRTTLHYAASKGWLKIAEILLSHGAKINLKDKVGCTLLHRAASIGNSELCELLIEEGAEVDAIDKGVALLLIRHGANVDVEDKEGYIVLGRASVDLRPILIDAAKAMLED